jgi:hypothetical protein
VRRDITHHSHPFANLLLLGIRSVHLHVQYGDEVCQDRGHILVVSSAEKFDKYDMEVSYLYWESSGANVQTRLSSAMGKTTKHILHERMHSTWRSVLKLCI